MGLSASFGLKLAADAAFARGDVAEGKRLMREYNTAVARAEKHKNERKLNEAKKKKIEDERRALEAKRKKVR